MTTSEMGWLRTRLYPVIAGINPESAAEFAQASDSDCVCGLLIQKNGQRDCRLF